MGIAITGLFEPSGGPGSFNLYDPADIQAGNIDVLLTLISGGKVVCSGINGEITVQTFAGTPVHSANEGTPCWDSTGNKLYVNNNGTTGWTEVGAGGGVDPIQVQSLARSVLGLLDTSRFTVTGHTHTSADISDFGIAVQVYARQVLGQINFYDYLYSKGRSGGQTLAGGVAASENLLLTSTTNATKGKIWFGSVGGPAPYIDDATGNFQGNRYISLVSTGTSPFFCSSTTVCTNLNADLLDGLDSTAFALASHTHTASQITDFTEASQDIIGALLADSTTVNFTYNDGANSLTTAVIVEADQLIIAAQVFGP